MKGLIKWMAHNPVAANLLMLVFIVGGIIMGVSIKQEIFPEISLDKVQVSVAYPGSSPEEIEEGIILKIEENLSGISGIKQIKSVAAEGVGVVTAEILPGEDVNLVMQDIKAEVDRITTFPKDAEKPVIEKLVNRREVIYVAVYGDMPERSLHEYAETVKDDLLAKPQITQAELAGVRPYEISIDVPEENLRRYDLTLDTIADRVRRASLDLPAGTIKTSGAEILIRTKEKRYKGFEYAGITVLHNPDGTDVKLGEIANVRDTFRDTDEFSRFDGKPAALIAVFRVGDQKPTDISRAVKQYVIDKQAVLPPTVHLATLNDSSELLQSRMDLLTRNAFFGLILVFVALGLFLEIKLALWVMLGIPVSFLGALFLMPAMGVSINMLSLFAFIIALGIVVDDATVIGENIYEHRSMGKGYLQAAVDGTLEVAVPVIISSLTTIATFVPLVFISGNLGKFIKTIPLVVVPILLVSLTEALLILPAHLSHGKPIGVRHGLLGAIERVRTGFGDMVDRFVAGPYARTLALCARNRYATLAAAISILLISAGLVGGGVIKFHFMPEVDGDFVIASLRMPIGTPASQTAKVAAMLEGKARKLVSEYDAKRSDGVSVLRSTYSIVGGTITKGQLASDDSSGSNLAEVALILTPSEVRNVPSSEITNRWRAMVGDVPGADSLTFSANIIHFGSDIDVGLEHDDFRVLKAATARVKTALAGYPGVGDISDNYSLGKEEVRLRLRPEARTLGITEQDLGRQVRAAFYGSEALRFQRDKDELRVMVRYPENERKSLADLDRMRIHTPSGGEIPFAQAAFVDTGRGYSVINRTDRKRIIDVTATVNGKVANAEDINAELRGGLLQQLKRDYPGLSYTLEGADKERRESMSSMKKGFALGLFAVFALLAIPFRSYSQPIIIMTAIPFGIVGAILGHIMMGYDLSMLSLFGLVALSGVLVNDSLLLIDYINTKREEGMTDMEAVLEAGRRRFRPIILTSLTTAIGLLPMIMERSVQAQFLIPMAISLGFGILFATAITLLLIPSLYMILEDIRALFGLPPSHSRTAVEEEKLEEEFVSAE